MSIAEYLKSLGQTSEQVADSLRQQGIKGMKRSTRHCPIVNAVYMAIPDYWSGLRIGGGSKHKGRYSYCAYLCDDQVMDPQLPQPVMQFIGDFDHGGYPDLEAKMVKEVKTIVWE